MGTKKEKKFGIPSITELFVRVVAKQVAREIFDELKTKIDKEPVPTENKDWHIGAMWGLNKTMMFVDELKRKWLGDLNEDGRFY